MWQCAIEARLNNKIVYIRVLKNHLTEESLNNAIKQSIEKDFKNYDCKIVYQERT